MAESTSTVIAVVSVAFNVLVLPFIIWFAWPGIKIRLHKWKMRSGKTEASLFLYKNNNLNLMTHKRDGSRVKISGGSYASTPNPQFTYKLFGIPVRLRRENDPEDIDLWSRQNSTGLTAKELDNIVSEASGEGLAAILKMYLPIVIVVVIILAVLAIGALYMNYVNFEALKQIAPEMVQLIPESIQVKG